MFVKIPQKIHIRTQREPFVA